MVYDICTITTSSSAVALCSVIVRESSETTFKIGLKIGTRDYVNWSTNHVKLQQLAPCPGKWVKYNVQKFNHLFVDFCARKATKQVGIRHDFCKKLRVSVRIDFPGVAKIVFQLFPLMIFKALAMFSANYLTLCDILEQNVTICFIFGIR